MRVVFLTHNYPRHTGDLPGAFLHPLATALLARGHDVRVVAPSDRGQGGRDVLDGVPVRRVRYDSPGRETIGYEGRAMDAVRSLGGLLTLRRLFHSLRTGAREEARGAGDAVVHAHWWVPAGLAAPPELPAVVTLHGSDARLLERSLPARIIGGRLLRRRRVVTVVSAELAGVVARATGVESARSRVQPMPVRTVDVPWTTGGGGAFVVARLTAQKRVQLAIEAMARPGVRETVSRLTIIGDGPERPALERLAAARPTAAVEFPGALPHPQVIDRLGRADVLLFPARGEGFGLAAVEALMAGVPVVVCRDGGGVVDAVRAHGGGVVSDPEPGAFAEAIRAALLPESRRAARAAGAAWRTELTPERVAMRFEGWYREACGG